MKASGKCWAAGLAVVAWLLLLQIDFAGQTGVPIPTQPQQIRMSLIVTDRSNRSVEDVRQEDIQITEDGQPLKVSFFGKDGRPFRCVVAVDASGSFQSHLLAGVNVTKAIIGTKKPDDEMMIVKFVSHDKIETVQDFTPNGPLLLDSLKFLTLEGGQTAVIDAVYLAVTAAAERQANNPVVRGAVILITDGEDRSSFYTSDQLVKLLRGNDVQIFVIGIMLHLDKERGVTRPSSREKAQKLLLKLGEESGGRVFFPKNDAELTEATKQIFLDLNSQYLIGFNRQPKAGENGFRKVKISVVNDPRSKDLVTITRPGYLVGPRETTKGSKSQ